MSSSFLFKSAAPWKFDVFKTRIFAREASLVGRANVCFKDMKFQSGNYQTDSSET